MVLPVKTELEEVADNLRFEFTKDPVTIRKFIECRRSFYDYDPRFKGFRVYGSSEEDFYFSPHVEVLVVRKDGDCIGGVCLTISQPNANVRFALEDDISCSPATTRFSLKEYFQELNLGNHSYAEYSHFAIINSFRSKECINEISRILMTRCLTLGVRHVFAMSDLLRARLYKQIHKHWGIETKIHLDLDVPDRPEYEGLKMYLLSSDLSSKNGSVDL